MARAALDAVVVILNLNATRVADAAGRTKRDPARVATSSARPRRGVHGQVQVSRPRRAQRRRAYREPAGPRSIYATTFTLDNLTAQYSTSWASPVLP